MNAPAPFDEARAHKHFAAECFNWTWNLIEKPCRTPEDDEQMRSLCHASLWHWTQRDDCTPRNLSIGYWQLSRVYALLGRAEDATRYGELCLRHSESEAPFYIGYAHEALARAAMVGGDARRLSEHLGAARQFAAQVTNPEEREMLVKDLDGIQ
jgi:hypothetical protein